MSLRHKNRVGKGVGMADRVQETTLQPYVDRLSDRAATVLNLVGLHASLEGSRDISSQEAVHDILLASVVFTHALLEDFLHTIAVEFLPEAGEQVLSQTPLNGVNTDGRASIDSVAGIATLVQSIGVEVAKVNYLLPSLEQLMKRRHLIVHGADRTEPLNSVRKIGLDIKCSDVTKWLLAVIEFASELLTPIGIRQINGSRLERDSLQPGTERNHKKRRTSLN